MALLRVRQVEEIAEHLLLLPALVGRQQARSPAFPRECVDWLAGLEAILLANKLHEAGSIAALRSGLLSALRGAAPAGLEVQGTRTRSKVAEAAAAAAVQRASEIASNVLAPQQARLAEAEKLARQLVAVTVSRTGDALRYSDAPREAFLQGLRHGFRAQPDLEGAAALLESLVGPHDSLILLDRAVAFIFAPA